MKCNKCGTPIIPNETRCRFCGAVNDFSKIDDEKNYQPEIIDEIHEVINEEPEIIDIIDEPIKKIIKKAPIIEKKEIISENDDKSIEESKEPVKVVKKIEQKKIETKKEPIKKKEIVKKDNISEIIDDKTESKKILKRSLPKDIEIADELSKTSKLEPVDINEFTGQISKKDALNLKKELTKSNNKINANDENNKKIKKITGQKIQSEPIIREMIEEDKNKINKLKCLLLVFGISIFVLIIICAFLYLNRDTQNVNIKTENTYSNVSFNDYTFAIPGNYTYTIHDNQLYVYNELDEWACSIETESDIDFNSIESNKDSIIGEFAKTNFLFTSSYNKNVNDRDFYLFKGKYGAYSGYYIISKSINNNVILVNLKFKNEVDDKVLEKIIEIVSSAKNGEFQEFFNNDFNFESGKDIIKNNAPLVKGDEG